MENLIIPTMLTIKETAEKFGLSEYFVRKEVGTGRVVAIKSGNKVLVNAGKFIEYLNSNTLSSEAGKTPEHKFTKAKIFSRPSKALMTPIPKK